MKEKRQQSEPILVHACQNTDEANGHLPRIMALTGFMGSGKTSVGRTLATMLGCAFLDLDKEIEKAAGKSIPCIFREDGEKAFRKLEISTLQKILKSGGREISSEGGENRGSGEGSWDLVLSLGGGTVLKSKARALLEGRCKIIYLKASPETLLSHLSEEAEGRPLLAGHDLSIRIGTLLPKRDAIYSKVADIIVDTDGKSIKETAEYIIGL